MASSSFFCVFLTLCSAAIAAVPAHQEVVSVTVYFESYCPDSVKFLTKQLYPVYLTPLGAFMNITLVPYGKASTSVNEAGEYVFTCHHGEKECIGNKVIACVLKEKDASIADQLKFINCTSSIIAANTKLDEYPVSQCASVSSVKSEEVMSCTGNMTSSIYLAEYGNKTKALTPPLTSVPTVVFNEKFMEAEHKLALTDFRKALCSKISGTKPAECIKSSGVPLQTALLPIIISLIFISRV